MRSVEVCVLTRKEQAMDFAILLVLGNAVLAGFIYFLVTRIWQG
jgi:hypothetical protein